MTQPQLLNTAKLLEKNIFKIPKYQRPYSWTKRELDDLFDDINELFKKNKNNDANREHFMATIVTLNLGKKSEQGKEFLQLQVVDGQQRLTSLCILLKSLSLTLNEQNDDDSKGIANTINDILVKNGNDNMVIIHTNYDRQSVFANYIINGQAPSHDFKATTITEGNLLNAIKLSEIFIKSFLDSRNSLTKLYGTIAFKLNFLLHIQEDMKSVYTTFEVLNSRGKAVAVLDKCKSILMGRVAEMENHEDKLNQLNRHWENIFLEIGTIKINTEHIVRMAVTILDGKHTKNMRSSEESLDFFKKHEADFSTIVNWHKTLENITKKAAELAKDTKKKAIYKVSQVKFLFIAVLLRDLDTKNKNIILKQVENVSFRTYGFAGLDSRYEKGKYIELAQRIIEETPEQAILTVAEIKTEIKNLGADYKIKDVIKKITKKDLYKATDWKEEFRYFMYKYEEYLASRLPGKNIDQKLWNQIWEGTADKSIEHIMPINASAKVDWVNTVNSINKKELSIYTNRLGNLMLLTQKTNSEAQDKSFKEKKDIYKDQSNLLSVKEVCKKNVWNKKSIEDREKKLLEAARVIWK